ncbi:RIP metalloprotease RseP [Neoehrlichia mikurensis]|uniref:Zinc metalloprotease n=1 Tax=Neoehrlichia mikurensis TaxID=89586 RepID=A0A9Q9BTE4_9RICK|nr:RIP metalloprotease RseP [Neoehrlichia mikurensis]QXK91629.1 RIP metalloprotease RseP [Neoehrlichia mikurensis]QXK92840.1 RIP metalloprotease RseP [Neoehrlichia mikurensis]QXK93320.1 RIP metalloprotease RseP [Neoehrlichia mikurensis]UTO55737.1 RIP metalloprotease RseP [Neoehrlichia mikurensis]UTO56654.1 RIP metalloprotease RseP [Neoehrlichia mikurensis]
MIPLAKIFSTAHDSFFYLSSFIFIISIIVFIHEYGHYVVAKICNVKIEAFSIGFGPELFGIKDKSGTRWKFSLIPIGGYVKMFGDANVASTGASTSDLTAEEKLVAFYEKSLLQKFCIAFAGPLANLLFAIVVLTVFFSVQGVMHPMAVIGKVEPNSVAERAGLVAGDIILKVNNHDVKWFTDIQKYIIENGNKKLSIQYLRQNVQNTVTIYPEMRTIRKLQIPFLGISASQLRQDYQLQKLSVTSAFISSSIYTYNLICTTLTAIWQMITGQRSINELGGPIQIAKYSGYSVKNNEVLWFMGMISINLGVINLLPIPMLDGGHMLQYTIQGILRRKHISAKFQNYAAVLGFILLLFLMIFATLNDIKAILK